MNGCFNLIHLIIQFLLSLEPFNLSLFVRMKITNCICCMMICILGSAFYLFVGECVQLSH